MKKIIKRTISLVSALTMLGSLQISTFASNDIDLLAEDTKEILLEEDGKAYVNGSETADETMGSVKFTGNGIASYSNATKYSRGTVMARKTGEGSSTPYDSELSYAEYTIKNATPGEYKLAVFQPAEAYQVATFAYMNDQIVGKQSAVTTEYGSAGSGKFMEYGTVTLTGDPEKDIIKLKAPKVPDEHKNAVGYTYNGGWWVYYDAIKLTLIAKTPTGEDAKGIVLEEDGKVYIDGIETAGIGSVEFVGSKIDSVTGSGYNRGKAKQSKVGGSGKAYDSEYSYAEYKFNNMSPGLYKLEVFQPTKDYQVITFAYMNDKVVGKPSKFSTDWGTAGSGTFMEYGTIFLTGDSQKDIIKLKTPSPDDRQPSFGSGYNGGWNVCYDAIKLTPISCADGEGNVDELVLENDGKAYVNGSDTAVTNYGYVKTNGTVKTLTGDVYNNGSAYHANVGADGVFNSELTSADYCVSVDEGYYRLEVFQPMKSYQVATWAYINGEPVGQPTHYNTDWGQTNGRGRYMEYGVVKLTGDPSKDVITLKVPKPEEHSCQNGSYNAGWNVYYDAIKLTKVDTKDRQEYLVKGSMGGDGVFSGEFEAFKWCSESSPNTKVIIVATYDSTTDKMKTVTMNTVSATADGVIVPFETAVHPGYTSDDTVKMFVLSDAEKIVPVSYYTK